MAERLARAPRALLHAARRQLPGRPRPPADGRLRRAQRDQGRAVHARRSRQLPQHAHLPPAGGAAEGAVAVPLRAEPRRRAASSARARAPAPLAHDFETVDKHWRIYRKHSDARMPVDPRFQPARRRARAALAPAARTGGALLALAAARHVRRAARRGHAAEPPRQRRGELVHAFGGASRFSSMRDGRQGARRPRHRRQPSSGWCSSAASSAR